MKSLHFLLAAICSSVMAIAQSTSPQVVSTAGNHFANGTHQLSFTIGEPVIQTLGNSSATLTQGFHQSDISVVSIEVLQSWSDIKVYPNPAVSALNIEIGDFTGGFWLNLYSTNGRLLKQKKMESAKASLDLSDLAEGVYVLRFSGDQAPAKTYSIIKTN